EIDLRGEGLAGIRALVQPLESAAAVARRSEDPLARELVRGPAVRLQLGGELPGGETNGRPLAREPEHDGRGAIGVHEPVALEKEDAEPRAVDQGVVVALAGPQRAHVVVEK